MRHSLKNRIISGFAVLSLIVSTFGSVTMSFAEGEPEASLYAVMSEKSEEAEVSVFSSSDDSEIEVVCATETDAEIAAEEGLEVVENYLISEREEESDETLFVKAEQNDDAELLPCESMSIYSVENEELNDVIIEDIAEEKGLCEIDNDVTEFALVKDSGFRHMNFELHPKKDEKSTVTLEGMIPKDATAEAVDVTGETASSGDADESKSVVAAYDITIKDGKDEYQPSEDRPIAVEIMCSDIKADDELQLWHIKDDGSREQIEDFDVEDGRVSFDATGFSVYEIVKNENMLPISEGWHKIASMEELKDYIVPDDSGNVKGLYIGQVKGFYFKNDLVSDGTRTGIGKTKPAKGDPSGTQAAQYYFEPVEGTDNKFYIYCLNGTTKQYVYNNNNNSLSFANSESDKTAFTVTASSAGIFKLNNGAWYWNMQGGDNGTRFCSYNNATDANNNMYLWYYEESDDDPYELNGTTYGLMHMTGSTSGNALVADVNNSVSMISVDVRFENNNKTEVKTVYSSGDDDISMWTFHCTGGNNYKLSTVKGGTTKYLKVSGNSLEMVDSEAEATAFKITPNNSKQFKLVSESGSIYYDDNSGFVFGNNDNASWLDLMVVSDISESEITYAADKVGMSDPEVTNGQQVIVYTRVWDDSKKMYRFYAIDHDGSLYPCFERGENIMWIGDKINTLLWTFTEYYGDDGKPNYYYELYNAYSGKYLAPLIKDGQVLSNKKVGINLPGRRDGEYYSTILAWDNDYYSYAGLAENNNHSGVVSVPRGDADTFYFAIPTEPESELTKVDTIDNKQYGITMKIKDFDDKPTGGHNIQDEVLEDYTIWDNHKNSTVPGLLSTDIVNGYPTAVNTNRSLYELFSDATEVNHLFLSSTYGASGYFEFDSTQNYATLIDPDTGQLGTDFTVYKELGTRDDSSKNTLQHGQFMPFNTIVPGVYSTKNPKNLYDALANVLPDSDPRKYEKLHSISNPNAYFGMEVEASFVQTPSGKDAWGHDIIFEFTGDDDFWFYVDDELVIDLGGIHSALSGKVNFSTGEVEVNGTNTTLKELFRANYVKRGMSETEIDQKINEIFGDGEDFQDYTDHVLRIFYMERGAGASNLHMRFNLNYVTPGSVMLTKKLTGTESLGDNIDFSLAEYPYQIWYKLSENTPDDQAVLLKNTDSFVSVKYQNSTQRVEYKESYTPPKATQPYESVYFLSPDKIAEIHFPEDIYSYKIVECGVNTEVYDSVSVTGIDDTKIVKEQTPGNTARYSYATPWDTAENRKTVEFNNHVNAEGLRTLSVTKVLLGEDGNEASPLLRADDPTTFDFRLYLTNGADDQLELANMHKYHVRDENNNLCKWDASTRGFLSIGKTDYSSLSEAEKKAVTFETSMNGSISCIPAGYTVEVPGLPVGTLFKVVERDEEIPLGYKRVRYNRDNDSFYTNSSVEDGDTESSGRVRAKESPSMEIINQRGWEIEVNKDWTDNEYMTHYDPIYTAVYVEGDSPTDLQLVEGTIRRMSYPNTHFRYFFNPLMTGKTFDQYHICEVKLTNPAVNDETNVVTSYDSIEIIHDGEFNNINATAKGSDAASPHSYAVTYDQGTPKDSASGYAEDVNGNVRSDTITNTRSGGVVISIYDMKDQTTPLTGGQFILQKHNIATDTYEDVGTYEADSRGRITILYDFDVYESGYDYKLTEKVSPNGYIGLPNPLTFSIHGNDTVDIAGNETEWQKVTMSDKTSGDKLIAYIDIFNKPYVLQVYKYDGNSNGELENAEFELYKGVNGGLGGIVKDRNPIPGYESLVTQEHGLIPSIDNNLSAGRYYLNEKTPPQGYIGLTGDIVFDILETGGIALVEAPAGSMVDLHVDKTTVQDTYIYKLNIPNSRDGYKYTITKTVTGNMGNRNEDFTFEFEVTGGDPNAKYAWTKNNQIQTEQLQSGGTFTMKHGDTIVITVSSGLNVKIKEQLPVGYESTFNYNNTGAEKVSEKTCEITGDSTLDIVNSRTASIPTGVWLPIAILLEIAAILVLAIIIFMKRARRLRKAADN